MSDTTGAASNGAASTDAPLSILDQGDAIHETKPVVTRPRRVERTSQPPRERPEEDEIQASEDADAQPELPLGASEGDLEGEEGDADGEAEAEPSEGEEPETESEQERQTRSDKKERLRDGREVTIGELKRAYEDREALATYQAQLRGDYEARVREVDAYRQHQTQIIQQLEQHLQQAVAESQAHIPPAPDENLREKDPFAFQQQWIDHRDAIERAQARSYQLQQLQQQNHAQAQQQLGAFIQQETETFFQRVPELRHPERMKAFRQEAHHVLGSRYGFRPEEIDGNPDHRVVLAYLDLIELDRIRAARSKGREALKAKTAGAPPVQRPPVQNGIRQSAGTRSARTIQELKRLQKDPNASPRDRQRAGELLLSRF